MPKITAGGGASNVREELDPAVSTVAPSSASDGPTVELTRAEDPNAPAPRPGEHVVFFVGEHDVTANVVSDTLPTDGDEQPGEDEEPEESVEEADAPAPSAKRAARKVARGSAV